MTWKTKTPPAEELMEEIRVLKRTINRIKNYIIEHEGFLIDPEDYENECYDRNME